MRITTRPLTRGQQRQYMPWPSSVSTAQAQHLFQAWMSKRKQERMVEKVNMGQCFPQACGTGYGYRHACLGSFSIGDYGDKYEATILVGRG